MRRYKAKRVKIRCYQEGVGQFEPRFQEEEAVPREYFLVFTKLDTLAIWQCKLHRAMCRRFDTYQCVTDRRTDGIAIASTELAMRALRRAVKMYFKLIQAGEVLGLKLMRQISCPES